MGVKDFPQESLPINGANFGLCLMQEVKEGSRDTFNDDFLFHNLKICLLFIIPIVHTKKGTQLLPEKKTTTAVYGRAESRNL